MSQYRPIKYKDRPKQLRTLARALNMNFYLEDPFGTDILLSDFKLFKRGRNKHITNMLHSIDEFMEIDIRIFDYSYERYRSNNKRTYYQTVFFVKSKHLGLPEMFMKPENFFHRVSEYLKLKEDIDFEEYPKFSKQYWLVGPDEDYIRATMSSRVLHFFTVNKNWSLEGLNYFLTFYQDKKILHPKEVRRLVKEGSKLHDLFRLT